MNAPERPLRIGCFTVHDDRIVVVDDRAPVVAELDATTGDLVRVRSWEVPPWTGRRVASSVAIAAGAIAIASPAAGGIVFFDDDGDHGELVAFDVPIQELVVDHDAIWAIAETDGWGGADPALGWRPQVVIEPTAQEIVAAKARERRWLEAEVGRENAEMLLARNWAEPDDDEDDDEPDVEHDRSMAVRASTAVWRIEGRGARSVDIGAVVSLHPVDGAVFVVSERPGDPIVHRVDPLSGGGGFAYTVSILAGTPDTGFAVLRSASEIRDVVGVIDRGVWLDASDGDDYGHTGRVLGIDLDGGETSRNLPLDDVWLVVGDRVLGEKDDHLALTTLAGGAPVRLDLPRVHHWEHRVVAGGRVYFAPDHEQEEHDTARVVGVDLTTAEVLSVSIDVDCAPYLLSDAGSEDAAPITIPVELAGWELECCQPDATVGEPWTALMYVGSDEPADDHSFVFEGEVLREAEEPDGASLVAVGPVRLGIVGARTGDRSFRGTVYHEAHGDIEGVLDTEIEATGTVRRIQGVSYERRDMDLDGEPASWPVAQHPPVELHSTDDDRRFDVYVLTIEFGADASPG